MRFRTFCLLSLSDSGKLSKERQVISFKLLSIEWNSIRLGGHVPGIVTKTLHKTLPGGVKGVWGVGVFGI